MMLIKISKLLPDLVAWARNEAGGGGFKAILGGHSKAILGGHSKNMAWKSQTWFLEAELRKQRQITDLEGISPKCVSNRTYIQNL